MINNKKGPFKIPKLSDEYPMYAKVLAPWFEQLEHLPNFDTDSCLYLLSDFGGEHVGANFKTYSFLICSKDKNVIFDVESKKLREQFGLNEPLKEFSFKTLKYGQCKAALPQFLKLADSYIHGVLFTISIETTLETVFDLSKKKAYSKLIGILEENELGIWKGKEAEKLLRVCHPLAMFMSILSRENQSFIWVCDNDSINADGKHRNFSHTQKVFYHALHMYSDVQYKIYGFGKPFSDDSTIKDLLSLTDFSAGVMQEFLQEKILDKPIEVSEGKKKLIEWLATDSHFLMKYNFVLTKSKVNNSWDVGVVELSNKI